MIEWIHPALFFFSGSALIPFIKGRAKPFLLLGIPVLAFLSLLLFPEGDHGTFSFAGYTLVFGRVDRLSLIFGYIFTILAAIGMIYGLHVKHDGHHIAAYLYTGSALGAVFAGDLFTLFVFWEIMAFSSVFLIWYGGKGVGDTTNSIKSENASDAGFRYLMTHIFGGVCLLGGIVIYAVQSQSIAFNVISPSGFGGMLILIGFLVNAAAPPLHAWLPDAYPEATVAGTVFLSAYTTKTAVYVLARGFAGTDLLIYLGVLMALYGVFYAMLENDIRRLLAYHIISQVGFMVAGIGIGTELAINGAVAHAFTHILYKGLLMMGMGSVIFVTGKRKGTELGGLYRDMPLTFLFYMIAGFSISGVPLFSGFISKSMVLSAAAESHLSWAFLLLTMASVGTFLSTTLKLPYVVFFGEERGIKAKDPNRNMLLGMGVAASLCILLGVWPDLLYRLLPHPVEYHPYTGEHLLGSLQILFFTLLGFILFFHKLHPERTISLDFDWFYRKGAQAFMWLAKNPIAHYEEFIAEMYEFLLIKPAKRLAEMLWTFDTWVIDGLVNACGVITVLEGRISETFDIYVVDGAVNGISATMDLTARGMRRLQTGAIQNYLFIMVLGIGLLVVIFRWF